MGKSSQSNSNKMLTSQLERYFQNKSDVVAIYLFGSYALGKECDRSDIDIGIVFDGTDRQFMMEKRTAYMLELSRILRKDLHIVILNFATEQLMSQIFEKGKCVVVNDMKKLTQFKMVAFAKIADFAYYLRQMQSGFIKTIMGTQSSG